MKNKNLELRMYFLVMYNISEIQKSIQALHACVEYQLKYSKAKEYLDWAKKHKTVILLNGGTSNSGDLSMGESYRSYERLENIKEGTMEQHLQTLQENKIKCAAFYEPDLNYSLSAIAFLVDERVFNKKDYPDYIPASVIEFGADVMASDEEKFNKAYSDFLIKEKNEYVKKIGKDVAFLKDFLKQFRLA